MAGTDTVALAYNPTATGTATVGGAAVGGIPYAITTSGKVTLGGTSDAVMSGAYPVCYLNQPRFHTLTRR